MLLPVSWAAAFLFSVLNMYYPALASAPEPLCCVSDVYTAGWLAAGGLQCRFSAALRNPGKKKTRTAPLAESSQKTILFDYIVSIPRAARMCKRSFAILLGRFLAS